MSSVNPIMCSSCFRQSKSKTFEIFETSSQIWGDEASAALNMSTISLRRCNSAPETTDICLPPLLQNCDETLTNLHKNFAREQHKTKRQPHLIRPNSLSKLGMLMISIRACVFASRFTNEEFCLNRSQSSIRSKEFAGRAARKFRLTSLTMW